MTRIKAYSDWLWVTLSLILLVIAGLSLDLSQPAALRTTDGTTTVNITAEHKWILSPSGCTTVSWQIDGISALYVADEGRIGADSIEFCPQVNITSLEFQVVDQNNITRTYDFHVHYLPDVVLYILSFAGIAFAGLAVTYYLIVPDISRKPPIGFGIFVLIVLSIGVGALRDNAKSSPVIDTQQNDTYIYFITEHQRAWFPEECIDVQWQVINADTVTFNSIEQPLKGESKHCQQDGATATLTVDGTDHKIPLDFLFPHLLDTTWYAALSIVSLILCLLIYVPLFGQSVHRGWVDGHRQNFVAIGGLFSVTLVLYLPFGWSHVGHWEEWVIKAYIQGMPNSWLDNELRTRLFVIVPHTLAHILTPNSFIGYNILHMLMFFGKAAFLYGILRKLSVPELLAFLISALFIVYPLNSAIMSLRSFPMQFSALSLLMAGYIVQHLRENPSRLGLIGLWLALLFSVGANESGYLIILIAPLFWLILERRINWKVVNLTTLWMMMPALRLVFTLALLATNRGFYLSGNLDNMAGTPLERLQPILRALGNSYRLTFPQGWSEAINMLSTLDYLFWSIIGTVLVVLIAWRLSQQSTIATTVKQNIGLLIVGFLFLIPAVGVMISLDFYRNDTWRVFFYAPISGSVVMIGALYLLVNRISTEYIRRILLLVGTCILMFPAFNRALVQHDRFVNDAVAKENFFRSVVEQAPSINETANLIVLWDLPIDELTDVGLHELIRRDMFASAMFLLYDQMSPQFVFICVIDSFWFGR